MRTNEEITRAIERLKLNKERCFQYNYFGMDNHKSIDVMIHVLENQLTEDEIYQQYPSCNEKGEEDPQAHRLWQSAVTAYEFRNGRHKVDDILYPEKFPTDGPRHSITSNTPIK